MCEQELFLVVQTESGSLLEVNLNYLKGYIMNVDKGKMAEAHEVIDAIIAADTPVTAEVVSEDNEVVAYVQDKALDEEVQA